MPRAVRELRCRGRHVPVEMHIKAFSLGNTDFFFSLGSGQKVILEENKGSPQCKVIKVSLMEHNKNKHLVHLSFFVQNGPILSSRVYKCFCKY